jgi:hypothetical protein
LRRAHQTLPHPGREQQPKAALVAPGGLVLADQSDSVALA